MPGTRRAHRADRHRALRAGGEPPRQLPPDRFVARVGRRPQHPPPPRRFAGKHHRAALAVALRGDQRLRRAAGRHRHGQDLRAGPRSADVRDRRQRRQRRPFLPVLVRPTRPAASPDATRHRSVRAGVLGAVDRRLCADASAMVDRGDRSDRSAAPASSAVPARPWRSNDRAPSTSRPPPRCRDEVVGQLELIAREEIGLDVAEDHAVVGEELRALRTDSRSTAPPCATASACT